MDAERGERVVVVRAGVVTSSRRPPPGPASALAGAGLAVRRGRAVLAGGPVVAPVAGRGRVVFARHQSSWRASSQALASSSVQNMAGLADKRRAIGCRVRRAGWRGGPRCSRRALCATWVSAQARFAGDAGHAGLRRDCGAQLGRRRGRRGWRVRRRQRVSCARLAASSASAAAWPAAGRQRRANQAALGCSAPGRRRQCCSPACCAACCCCRSAAHCAAWPSLRLSWASRACCWPWCSRSCASAWSQCGLAGVHVQRLIGGDGGVFHAPPLADRLRQGRRGGAVGVRLRMRCSCASNWRLSATRLFQFGVALLACCWCCSRRHASSACCWLGQCCCASVLGRRRLA